jgi:nucleoid DNA-binding protein
MSATDKMNLTKREIAARISDNYPEFKQQDVAIIVQKTLDTVVDGLAEGRNVELRNFGVFEVKFRRARVGRNPNNPEQTVQIPPRAVVKFKAGKIMTERVEKLAKPAE